MELMNTVPEVFPRLTEAFEMQSGFLAHGVMSETFVYFDLNANMFMSVNVSP